MNTKNMVEYNIKLYREKKGLSQEEIAGLLDVSRLIGKNKKFITNLENGKYTKAENLKILVLISKQLDIEIQDLFEEIDTDNK